jgi:hypothetical protein
MKTAWDFQELKARLLISGLSAKAVERLTALLVQARQDGEDIANKVTPIILAWAKESLEMSNGWFYRQAIRLGWSKVEEFAYKLVDKINGKVG